MRRLSELFIRILVNSMLAKADAEEGTEEVVEDKQETIEELIARANAEKFAAAKKDEAPAGEPAVEPNAFEKAAKGFVPPVPDPKAKSNDEEIIKTHFGESFKSWDEVKAAVEKANKATEYEKQIQELTPIKDKYEEALKELEVEKSSKKFNNETLYKLDRLAGKSKEEYELVNRVMHNSSPLEILKEKFYTENPSYREKPEVAEKLILEKYSFTPLAETDEDGEPIQKNIDSNKERKQLIEEKMKLDASNARDSILKKLDEIELPKTLSEEELKAEKEKRENEKKESIKEYVSKWNEPYTKMKESITGISQTIKVGNADVEIDFPFTDEDKKQISDYMGNMIMAQTIDPEADEISTITNAAVGLHIANNLDKFVSGLSTEIAKKMADLTDKQMKDVLHNAQLPGAPASKANGGKSKSQESFERAKQG